MPKKDPIFAGASSSVCLPSGAFVRAGAQLPEKHGIKPDRLSEMLEDGTLSEEKPVILDPLKAAVARTSA